MTTIIAGHFQHPEDLHAAVQQLGHNGFEAVDYAAYYHDHPSSDRQGRDLGAGAYADTLANATGDAMLAINVDHPGAEAAAVAILGECRAQRIDRAHGGWAQGHWRDLDPRAPIDTLLDQDDTP